MAMSQRRLILSCVILLCIVSLGGSQSWSGKPPKKNSNKKPPSTNAGATGTLPSQLTAAAAAEKLLTATNDPPAKKVAPSTPSAISAAASPAAKAAAASGPVPGKKVPKSSVQPSASSLLFLKGSCPTTLCSGKAVSKGELEHKRGVFKIATPVDAVTTPGTNQDWSIDEVEALIGGNWPSNEKLGLCYDKKCPTNADVAAAVDEVRSGKDIIAVAQAYRHVNYGRLVKGLGPAMGPKATKAAAKAAKEL